MEDGDMDSLSEGDLAGREEVLYGLLDRARNGDDQARRALRVLVRNYRDFDPTLYTRALNQVALFGDATLEQPLLASLADSDYGCQAWAAMGCAALGFRAAVPGLLALLEHSEWIARDQAVLALGVLGEESAVPVLALLLGDPSVYMRERAAAALAAIGGHEALAALWDELEHRRFSRIGYIASALARFDPDVIPRLTEAAASNDPDTRYWAARALGATGAETVVPMLERMMVEDRGLTEFGGSVSVAAKKGLRTLRRIQSAATGRSGVEAGDSPVTP